MYWYILCSPFQADYQTPDHLKRARGIQVDGASRDAPLQQEVAPSLEQFAEQARLPLDAEAESAVQLASLRSRQRLKERITSMVEQELLQQMLADLQARRAPPPPHPAPAEPEPADELELRTFARPVLLFCTSTRMYCNWCVRTVYCSGIQRPSRLRNWWRTSF